MHGTSLGQFGIIWDNFVVRLIDGFDNGGGI